MSKKNKFEFKFVPGKNIENPMFLSSENTNKQQ